MVLFLHFLLGIMLAAEQVITTCLIQFRSAYYAYVIA